MSGYDWQTIFKIKDEKELIEIYRGDSHLNFEAKVFAGIELKIEISAISNKLSKNRQFEFEGSDSWLSLSNPKETPTTIQISPLIKVINKSKIACIQTTLRLYNK